jgi:sialate O-acetylesterase
MRIPLTLLALLYLGAPARADVVPAPLFTDNAVLQREKPVPVWGRADAGEKVSVTFAGSTVATTADAAGRWRVDLPAQRASATPADLVIKGNNAITLANVLVGEVWLASGQSNMEMAVKTTHDAALDVSASTNPLIRHIKIKRTVTETPAATVVIDKAAWQSAGPGTTGDFTAAGYYFALDVYNRLRVPVGIIHSSWGGSAIEPWLSASGFQTVPDVSAKVQARWARLVAEFPPKKAVFDAEVAVWLKERDAAKTAGRPFNLSWPREPQGPGTRDTPSGLYNAMIHPLTPYALRGVLWYQGEANVGRADEYAALFPALVADWRARFAQNDLAFHWVQLANYAGGDPQGTAWAFLREAQTRTLSVPATGQAVIMDIGNVNDIHPRNKKDVGRRLARLALNRTYGVPLPDSGPVFAGAERDGAGFRVSFTEIHGGLVCPFSELGGFELAGSDKIFRPAQARIAGDAVVVTSAEIPGPAAVRYAWRNAPVAGLFNQEGLPAAPFRSDTW